MNGRYLANSRIGKRHLNIRRGALKQKVPAGGRYFQVFQSFYVVIKTKQLGFFADRDPPGRS